MAATDRYTCKNCDKQYSSRVDLYLHKKTIHKSGENTRERMNPYHCDQCDYKSNSHYHLERHIWSKHGDKNTCKKCDKTFKGRTSIYEHMKKIHKSIKFKCNECNLELRGSSSIRRHIRKYHENIKRCHHCDYKCAERSSRCLEIME